MQIHTIPALLRNAFTGSCQKNLHQDAHIFIFTIDCTHISTLFTPIPSLIPTVLISAGTELTLFLVAGTVLGFGFSVRMMLIIR